MTRHTYLDRSRVQRGRPTFGGTTMEEVKQAEELLAMGGYFYSLNGEAWCDTPAASWRLVPGKGYVRDDPEMPDPGEGD